MTRLSRSPAVRLRQSINLTAAHVASQIGCSRTYLASLERGASVPSDRILAALATVYDQPLDVVERVFTVVRRELLKRQLEQVADSPLDSG